MGVDRKLVLHGTVAHRPAPIPVVKWRALTIVEVTLGRTLPWSSPFLRYRSEGVPLRFVFLADESRAFQPGSAILDLADHSPVDHQPGSCLAYQPSGQANPWFGSYMARLDFQARRSGLGFFASPSELRFLVRSAELRLLACHSKPRFLACRSELRFLACRSEPRLLACRSELRLRACHSELKFLPCGSGIRSLADRSDFKLLACRAESIFLA